MKKKLALLFLSVGAIVIGILLVGSPIGPTQVQYSASGTFRLNSLEWEDFKDELEREEIPLTRVTYLDDGGTKLVQLEMSTVTKDFRFGEITKFVSKIGIIPWIESVLVIGGLSGFISSLTVLFYRE